MTTPRRCQFCNNWARPSRRLCSRCSTRKGRATIETMPAPALPAWGDVARPVACGPAKAGETLFRDALLGALGKAMNWEDADAR
jgi:hypothetical protein